MYEASAIFLRTHAGRTEIHEKKCGLTQSERLVLIMVDGVSSYSAVRAKLPVLTEDRFARAIRTLMQKELIGEVLMPVQGEAPEEVELTVIDRFLQQDPLDPVTIIMYEDDERLDFSPEPASAPSPAQAQASASTPSSVSVEPSAPSPIPQEETPQLAVPPAPSPAMPTPMQAEAASAPHPRQAEELGEQTRPWQYQAPPAALGIDTGPELDWDRPRRRRFAAGDTTWIYLGMAVVGAFILGYAFARLTA